MSIQRVHLFHCPNKNCHDHTVLPRQSHLGRFDGRSNPATDIWPIRYLCLYCGQPSAVQASKIRQDSVETQDQYQLVRYDFSSDRSGSLEHFGIYTKERMQHDGSLHRPTETGREAFERVLKPFGLVHDSFGDTVHVSVDHGLRHLLPMSAKRGSL
jgi:hypothetical protein